MMVPDEVTMKHEVVKCGMCIVKKINVVVVCPFNHPRR